MNHLNIYPDLILDHSSEPTANLDSRLAKLVMNTLTDYAILIIWFLSFFSKYFIGNVVNELLKQLAIILLRKLVNPAGSPHLSVIGQTGVGKTTLTKQILKENIRVQNAARYCCIIAFCHTSHYYKHSI